MTETYYYNSKNIADIGLLDSQTIITCNLIVPGIFTANSSLSNQSTGFNILYDQVNTGCINLTNGLKINNTYGTADYVLTSTSNTSIWKQNISSQWTSITTSNAYSLNSNIYYNNNIGIGITSPITNLHIQGGTHIDLPYDLYNIQYSCNSIPGGIGNYTYFGYSSAFNYNGTISIISAPQLYIANSNGYTMIYRYNSSNNSWSSPEYLTNLYNYSYYKFGYSTAISYDGNTALVSAYPSCNYNAYPGSNLNGFVLAYKYTNNTWSSPSVLTNQFPSINSGFGFNVSLSGDGYTALISSPYINQPFISIYNYNSFTNIWDYSTALYVNYSAVFTYSYTGYCLSTNIDGSIIAFSHPNYSISNIYTGSSNYLVGNITTFSKSNLQDNFQNIQTVWSCNIIPNPYLYRDYSYFGRPMIISGDGTTLITASNVSSLSSYYLLTYKYTSNNIWSFSSSNILSIEIVSLSINYNSTILSVGKPYTSVNGSQSAGVCTIYKYINNSWKEIHSIAPPTNLLSSYINQAYINFSTFQSLSPNGNIINIGCISYYAGVNIGYLSSYSTIPKFCIISSNILQPNQNNSIYYYNNNLNINTNYLYLNGYLQSGHNDGTGGIKGLFYTRGLTNWSSGTNIRIETSGSTTNWGSYCDISTSYTAGTPGTSIASYNGNNATAPIWITCSALYAISPLFNITGDTPGLIIQTNSAVAGHDPYMSFQNSSGTGKLRLGYSIQNAYSWMTNGAEDKIRFNDNSGGAIILQPTSGNVGINTTSTANTLSVGGGVSIGGFFNSITAPTNGLIVTGNVGIGTAVALSQLCVSGGTSIGSYMTVTAPTNGLIVSGNVGIATNTPSCLLSFGQQIKNKVIAIYDASPNESTTSGSNFYGFGVNNNYLRFQVSGSGTTPSDGFYWYSANTERMRIQASTGYLGINTASPSFLVHSAQDVALTTDVAPGTAQMAISGATDPTKRMVFGYDTTSAGNGYGFIKAGKYGTAWTNIALQPNGGNVGIGTTVPNSIFNVYGGTTVLSSSTNNAAPYVSPCTLHLRGALSTSTQLIWEAVNLNTAGITAGSTSPYGLSYGTQTGDHIFRTGCTYNGDFSTTGTERMRLQGTTGYLGISTSSPGSLLSFGTPILNKIITLYDGNSGDAVSTATNFYGFGINGSTLRYQTPAAGTIHLFYIGATSYYQITTAGGANVSDRKYKTCIEPITNALSSIEKLQGITFKMQDIEKRQMGFIAQDVKLIIPEVVTYNNDTDTHFLSYDKLTALLCEGIKELSATVKSQSLTIQSQSITINSLETRIAALEAKLL